MSTVPQAAFAVRKYRENAEKQQRTNNNNNIYADINDGGVLGKSPTKYSSKFMNSIWGMYNRYSVHNLKKIMDEMINGQQQQKYAIKLSKIWLTYFVVSQCCQFVL